MSSSAPQPGSGGDGGSGGEGGGKEDVVSKAAGFVVFSGIAMNIVKALTPKFPPQQPPPPQPSPSPSPPLHDQAAKPTAREEKPSRGSPEPPPPPKAPRTIEIVQGDTLWGLSRKHGVPISEIKKANGLTGDTIYAGKKLVIP